MKRTYLNIIAVMALIAGTQAQALIVEALALTGIAAAGLAGTEYAGWTNLTRSEFKLGNLSPLTWNMRANTAYKTMYGSGQEDTKEKRLYFAQNKNKQYKIKLWHEENKQKALARDFELKSKIFAGPKQDEIQARNKAMVAKCSNTASSAEDCNKAVADLQIAVNELKVMAQDRTQAAQNRTINDQTVEKYRRKVSVLNLEVQQLGGTPASYEEALMTDAELAKEERIKQENKVKEARELRRLEKERKLQEKQTQQELQDLHLKAIEGFTQKREQELKNARVKNFVNDVSTYFSNLGSDVKARWESGNMMPSNDTLTGTIVVAAGTAYAARRGCVKLNKFKTTVNDFKSMTKEEWLYGKKPAVNNSQANANGADNAATK